MELQTLKAEKTWPLAPNGVFLTCQGEGNLLGVPMIFVRLAGCSVGCEQCFYGATEIRMGDFSTRLISEVRAGDSVLSYDERSGQFVPNRVSRVMSRLTHRVYAVDVGSNNKTYATGEHPFLVRGRDWVAAKDLRPGDHVLRLSMSELKRLHNPMRDPAVARKTAETRKRLGIANPLLRPEVRVKAAEAARRRMLERNPMKDPATAVKGFLNRKDRGRTSSVEAFVLVACDGLNLRFTGGGDLVVGHKVPDFIIWGTRKLVEAWDADQTEHFGRDAAWMDARRQLYATHGYEVLFLPCTPYPLHDRVGSRKPGRAERRDAEMDRVRREVAEYARNGEEVLSVGPISATERPKVWVRLAGSLSANLTVYNLEVEETHTYVANGMVVHNCDTDYRVSRRATLAELRDAVSRVRLGCVGWLHVTGGEPTDHDLTPLIALGHDVGLRVAVATAGTRRVQQGLRYGGVDFLSVSPHRLDASWVQRSGSQVVMVPGLNGLTFDEIRTADVTGFPPNGRFVTPLADREGRLTNVRECVDFVTCNAGWRLNVQAHKLWGVA